jgi:diaminohydroxyphosphoribosylaminopyrimidine deaminase/5-amino-6-(5-phosphoribosylamino)uracil reductase
MNRPTSRSAIARVNDEKFMQAALRLSLLGQGFTEPNPMVGAVTVKNNRLLSSGYHRAYGAVHAEVMALENLHVPGATLYLTLEPCCHFGKTPPCTELIIAKKVSRVVMAMEDPNPLVSGQGRRRLEACGIRTECGLLADWAARVNRHYLRSMRSATPYVTIHAGVSLDGKLADRNGRSQWITSAELRSVAHSLRGEFSAILAGHNTVILDDPQLTLREAGWPGKRLYRVVLDSANSLPRHLRIFAEQERFPLIIFSSQQAADQTQKVPLHFFVSDSGSGLDWSEVFATLHRLGIASVLVEGGGQVIDSLIRERRFDEIVLFLSPQFVGGRESVQLFATGCHSLDQALRLERWERVELSSGTIMRGYPTCSPASS